MSRTRTLLLASATLCAALFSLTRPAHARQTGADPSLDADDIGGVVSGPKGPEAGVWVVAETQDLPTRFTRIVVTDDKGRYVLPDLPKAGYLVFVRGYGLVDSPKVPAMPGARLDLTARPAPSRRAAAQYYPASAWLALLRLPATGDFPGTGATGNGLAETLPTQEAFLSGLLGGCVSCHQLGTKFTREKSASPFPDSVAAWDHRVAVGQSGAAMSAALTGLGRPRALAMLADWTDRVTKGEVPEPPARPLGVERNVVITLWDWAGPREFVRGVTATDARRPRANADGLVFGTPDISANALVMLDPLRHRVTRVATAAADPKLPPPAISRTMPAASPVWGKEVLWTGRSAPHSARMDDKGRVWATAAVRPARQPAWCHTLPSALALRKGPSRRQLVVYTPATRRTTAINLCFGTDQLALAADGTLWFPDGEAPGFFRTATWDRTKNARTAQGWTALVVDTNGNGVRDAVVGPDDPPDQAHDTRIRVGAPAAGTGAQTGGVAISPTDGAVWMVVPGATGALLRLSPGANPALTALTEIYRPPSGQGAHGLASGPALDATGVVWVALVSGHLASFDRTRCTVLVGPETLAGTHCPAGWSLHRDPGPRFRGTDTTADVHEATWVDTPDVLGLGAGTPVLAGANADAVYARRADGTFITLRVPYPRGFMPKSLDGRIDDPATGWKGRGLWSSYGAQPAWHTEGGKGQTSRAVKIQLRPDPLAK